MKLTNVETAIKMRDELIEKQAKEIKKYKVSQKKLMKALTDLIINCNSDKHWDKAFDTANAINPDWSTPTIKNIKNKLQPSATCGKIATGGKHEN